MVSMSLQFARFVAATMSNHPGERGLDPLSGHAEGFQELVCCPARIATLDVGGRENWRQQAAIDQ